PDVGRSIAAARCSSVDLPLPLRPTTASELPAGTPTDTSRNACTDAPPSREKERDAQSNSSERVAMPRSYDPRAAPEPPGSPRRRALHPGGGAARTVLGPPDAARGRHDEGVSPAPRDPPAGAAGAGLPVLRRRHEPGADHPAVAAIRDPHGPADR